MLAIRVHQFGPPAAIVAEDIPVPAPGPNEVLVRVHASGVGPWDAWIRAGQSALGQSLPLTLGSDLAGIITATGSDVQSLAVGDRIYGVTNSLFTNANAEYAIARSDKVAPLPDCLDFVQGASIPVIAVTAWQMLVEHARVKSGQTILVTGANGNVGAYAIRLARMLGAHVVAMDRPEAADALRALGANEVMGPVADYTGRFDAVLDLVGAESQSLLLPAVKQGGIFISAVAPPPADLAEQLGVRARFFYVDVTTAVLGRIAESFKRGELVTRVSTVLPLDQARVAHEMLAGTRDRNPGKIVLQGP